MPVAWDDILMAFEFVSHDGFGNQAFVSRETGAVYSRSEYGDESDELPDDIESAQNTWRFPAPATSTSARGSSCASPTKS